MCVCVCVQRMCAARVRTCLRETMSGYVCVHACMIETQCVCAHLRLCVGVGKRGEASDFLE